MGRGSCSSEVGEGENLRGGGAYKRAGVGAGSIRSLEGVEVAARTAAAANVVRAGKRGEMGLWLGGDWVQAEGRALCEGASLQESEGRRGAEAAQA